MTMLSTILGFSAFGLASRFGQLGIQKRNLFSNPGGHLIAMMVFGYAGYWEYKWEVRADELIALKRTEIAEQRKREVATVETLAASMLSEAETQ